MGRWFDSDYRHRVPIALDHSAVGAVPATVDIEIEVPKEWDLFWTTIRSDMLDVVVCDSDSNVVPFNFKAGYSSVTQTLTLQLDAMPVDPANSLQQYFLYFGYASESVDRKVAVSISSAGKGYIHIGAPFARIVTPTNNRPALNQPQTVFPKSTTEEIDIFFAVGGLLAPRIDRYNKRLNYEEIQVVIVRSYDAAGSTSDSRYDLDETRFINGFVKVRAIAGSANTDYALSLQIVTTEKQKYDIRCIIQTKDLLPS